MLDKIKGIITDFNGFLKTIKNSLLSMKSKDNTRFDIGVTDIKKAYTNVPKRLAYMTLAIAFIIMLLMTIYIVQKQVSAVEKKAQVRAAEKKQEGVVDISLDDQAWKHYQSKRIDHIEKNVATKLNENQKKILSALDKFKTEIQKDQNITVGKTKEYVNSLDKKLQIYQENIDQKLASTVQTVNEKTEAIKKDIIANKNTVSSVGLNKNSILLPPPLNSVKETSSAPKVLQPKNVKINKNTSVQAEEKKVKIVSPDDDEYNYDDVVIDNTQVASTKISTALYDDTIKVAKKKTKLPYHIMKGLTKATLLTGVNAPTFGSTNNKNPTPILFSVDGDAVIANYEDEKLGDCLVTGSATGNVNTGKADVLLTEISCSGYDEKGNRIKIEQPIKGWVLGEDGSFGLDGRIVDSSGKVISKMIALSMIKSLTTAFVLSSQQANTGTITGLGSTTAQTQPNYGSAAQNGLGVGVQKGLDHAFEHYNQVLTGMYPTISVRAGKKVTLLLKGGEDVSPSKYKKVDISEEFSDEK